MEARGDLRECLDCDGSILGVLGPRRDRTRGDTAMRYLQGDELRQYEAWADRNLRPRLILALEMPQGKLIDSVEMLERGLRLVKYLKRAKNVERQIQSQ